LNRQVPVWPKSLAGAAAPGGISPNARDHFWGIERRRSFKEVSAMWSVRGVVAAVMVGGALAWSSSAAADDRSMAQVALSGSKAVGVQEQEYNLALSKAAQDEALRGQIAPAGERLRQHLVLLSLALGQQQPSSDVGRRAKAKLLDALRREYDAVGVIDEVMASGADDRAARKRVKQAAGEFAEIRAEALAAGKLLRRILNRD